MIAVFDLLQRRRFILDVCELTFFVARSIGALVNSFPGYAIDDSTYLVDFFSAKIKQAQSITQSEESDERSDFILDLEEVSSLGEDVLAHLAGFLLKPIIRTVEHCSVCMLAAEEPGQEHHLAQLNEYVQGGKF